MTPDIQYRNPRRSSTKSKSSSSSCLNYHQLLLVIFSGTLSYYIGFHLNYNISNTLCLVEENNVGAMKKESFIINEDLDELDLIEKLVQERIEIAKASQLLKNTNDENQKNNDYFPPSIKNFAVGIAKTPRDKFLNEFDYGTPEPIEKHGTDDVIILYNTPKSLPSNMANKRLQNSDEIPTLALSDAIENCHTMNIVYQDPSHDEARCLAIIGNYENYHIQKWLRIPPPPTEKGKQPNNKQSDSSTNLPFPMVTVGRASTSSGNNPFQPPTEKNLMTHWSRLEQYLNSYEKVLNDLRPLVEKVATKDKTVIVMTTNSGQADILANFVCSARARNFESLNNVLVFATDMGAYNISTALDLTTFYSHENFASLSSKEAKRYADQTFGDMMFAKVLCVQLVNLLGYDVLFQDVDIVWYQDPLPHLKSSQFHPYDIIFQDDGNRGSRFGPSSANSGFYYAKYNPKTQYLFTSLLYFSDLIVQSKSHQQVLIQLMNEFSSLYGLRIKILDGNEYPCGFQYHRKKSLMKDIVEQRHVPYLFHMSWTENKKNKILYFKQMGLWYVNEEYEGDGLLTLLTDEMGLSIESNVYLNGCCSVEPLITCHYRDKASIIPCKDSPPIDKWGKSFW